MINGKGKLFSLIPWPSEIQSRLAAASEFARAKREAKRETAKQIGSSYSIHLLVNPKYSPAPPEMTKSGEANVPVIPAGEPL